MKSCRGHMRYAELSCAASEGPCQPGIAWRLSSSPTLHEGYCPAQSAPTHLTASTKVFVRFCAHHAVEMLPVPLCERRPGLRTAASRAHMASSAVLHACHHLQSFSTAPREAPSQEISGCRCGRSL